MTESWPGEVLIQRRMIRSRELILARGQFTKLFDAYEDHIKTWNLHVDALGLVMARQALGGSALYLSSRPRDESIAFTFNFAHPALNVFTAGSSEDGIVTARVFEKDVAQSESSRLYVQSSRSGGRNFSSVIEVEGLDLLLILDQYCKTSDQSPARFYEVADDEYMMAVSLPKEDNDWLESLSREEATELFDSAPILDEKTFWFHCGCDPLRMQDVMRNMFSGRMDDLFGDDPSVDISCPRCGRGWTIRRDQLEEGHSDQ